MDEKMLLQFAVGVGEILLRSGAETYRVEDTVERILSVKEGALPEAFVTPSGFFASVQGEVSGVTTRFVRVTDRSTNLERIVRANALSRHFVEGKLTIEEGFLELEKINASTPFANWLVVLSTGLLCLTFTVLFGGNIPDAISAYAVGILLGIFQRLAGMRGLASFLTNLLGGILVAILTLFFLSLGLGQHYELTIIGSIMPLVPGMAITTAVRDIMSGDFLSGTSRIAEAVITASAIAAGVGIVLSAFSMVGRVA